MLAAEVDDGVSVLAHRGDRAVRIRDVRIDDDDVATGATDTNGVALETDALPHVRPGLELQDDHPDSLK